MVLRISALLVIALLAGCADLPKKAGFTLQGKPIEGTEAPWHNRAVVGDVKALQCVEVIPVLMSRDPAWQIEHQDIRRSYERDGTTVPIERLAQRAVLYTALGVRRYVALLDDDKRGYNILLSCGSAKLLLRGTETVFLVSGDESRLSTIDGRVIWLAKGQKPWNLPKDFLASVGSSPRAFTTFRRGEAHGDEFFRALERMFPVRAEVNGVVYSVSADFVQVSQLTAGEHGLDCGISKGTIPVSSLGITATVFLNLVALSSNIRHGKGNCYRLDPPNRSLQSFVTTTIPSEGSGKGEGP